RLKLIENEDSLKVYQKALKAFNKLILQHKLILKTELNQIEKLEYQKQINSYIIDFNLKKHFSLSHFISNFTLLRLLVSFYIKIKNRLFQKSYWTTINKNNIV